MTREQASREARGALAQHETDMPPTPVADNVANSDIGALGDQP